MNAKKALLALVALFVGFWLFHDPGGLAQAAKSGTSQTWDLAEQLFRALIRFVDALV